MVLCDRFKKDWWLGTLYILVYGHILKVDGLSQNAYPVSFYSADLSWEGSSWVIITNPKSRKKMDCLDKWHVCILEGKFLSSNETLQESVKESDQAAVLLGHCL